MLTSVPTLVVELDTYCWTMQDVLEDRESRLLDCYNYGGVGVYSSNCGHDDDAGVRCNGKSFCYIYDPQITYTIEKLNYSKFLLKSLATQLVNCSYARRTTCQTNCHTMHQYFYLVKITSTIT